MLLGPVTGTREDGVGRRERAGGVRESEADPAGAEVDPEDAGHSLTSLRPVRPRSRARASASSRAADVLARHPARSPGSCPVPPPRSFADRAADRGRRDALLDEVLAHRDGDRGFRAVAGRAEDRDDPRAQASRAASVMRRRSSPARPSRRIAITPFVGLRGEVCRRPRPPASPAARRARRPASSPGRAAARPARGPPSGRR